MKHNLKNCIKLGVIIFTIVLFIPCGVYAKDRHESNNGSNAANKACAKAIFDGDVFTITEDGNNYHLKFHAKDGTWRVKVVWGANADFSNLFGKANPDDQTIRIVDMTTTKSDLTFTITKNQVDLQELYAIAELVEGTGINEKGKTIKYGLNNQGKKLETTDSNGKPTTCKAGKIYTDDENKIKINGTGAFFKTTIKPISSRVTFKLENASSEVQDECKALQKGYYGTNENEDISKNIPGDGYESYKTQMQKSFPFCWGGESSFDYTKDDIIEIRHAAVDAYREYYNLTSKDQQKLNKEYQDSLDNINKNEKEYTKIDYKDNRTNIKTLQCTNNQLAQRTEKFYTEVTEVDKANNNNACSVTCLEEMQVTYDPPVASTAGLCFQYKVTVRSKVTCKVDIDTSKIIWPTSPTACSYTPICNADASKTQAGPNEEFDSCIQECDGGKYSQECINKCYKKVYGNKTSNTKKTSSSTKNKIITETLNNTTSLQKNSENILKLGNNNTDPYYQITGCQTDGEIRNNVGTCAKEFYKLKRKDPRGKYVIPEKHDDWYTHLWEYNSGNYDVPSEQTYIKYIKKAALYYFRTEAEALKTIQSFWGDANGINGCGQKREYIIDDGGIKRQNTTCWKCDEVCGFNKDANQGDCVDSVSDAVSSIKKGFTTITDQLSKCSAKAECKEDTSTFNMSVDNTVMKDQDTKNKSNWKATNETNNDSKTCINPTEKNGDIKMFIPVLPSTEEHPEILPPDLEDNPVSCSTNPNGINGKCYGKYKSQYWHHYKTTITFPGTWINLKTGKRVYKKSDVDEATMREKENYYCVGYDYDSVNEYWWDWKMHEVNKDKVSPPEVEKKDNIKAAITKFGKYNWEVDINCFYALSNTVSGCPTSDPNYPTCNDTDKCVGDECLTTIDNVKLRPVDQADLFAGRTGKQIGFNWTSAAQDHVAKKASTLKAQSYGIDPGDYATTLQKEAKSNPNSVYSGTTDYSFHLTKDNINNLRDYVKANGYTSFTGKSNTNKNEKADINTYKEVPEIGLYYYKSGILHNPDTIYVSEFNMKDNILGYNNEKNK